MEFWKTTLLTPKKWVNSGRIPGNRAGISSKWQYIVVKSVNSGSRLPGWNPRSVPYYLCDLRQVAACLSFHMDKIRIIMMLTHRVVTTTKQVNILEYKVLRKIPDMYWVLLCICYYYYCFLLLSTVLKFKQDRQQLSILSLCNTGPEFWGKMSWQGTQVDEKELIIVYQIYL